MDWLSRTGVPSRRRQLAIAVVAGLVVGATLAPVAFGLFAESGTVAVVEVNGLLTADTVEPIAANLARAREDPDVGAVVLKINSPGGTVGGSERLYFAVQRTATEVPVVASVQETGASGAYYGLLPSDEVFVLPSSIVGSVGVTGPEPIPTRPDDSKSGPNKQTADPDHLRRVVETMKRGFVGSVVKHRGETIQMDRSQIASAEIYPGVQAVDNGFADRIGTLEDAITAAAERAGYDDVSVRTFRHHGRSSSVVLGSVETENRTVVVIDESAGYAGVDTPMYFMVYGEVRTDERVIATSTTNATADGRGAGS